MSETVRIPILRGRADRHPVVVAWALVSLEDAVLSQHTWTLSPSGYAHRVTPRPDPKRILMHREILGLHEGDPLIGDHINRDKLDNRRSNLRAITKAENNHNLPSYRNGGSRFRGVCWSKAKNCWRASGQLAGAWKHIGYFPSEIDAARAASIWRSENMAYAVEEDVAA